MALRIWAGLWVLALLVGLFALIWPNAAVGLFTSPATLITVQVLLVVLGLGLIALLLDAWRISRPPELARGHRLAFVDHQRGARPHCRAGGLVASASIVSAQRDLMGSVFAGGGDQEAKQGRYNILLMGGDAGKDRSGLRPDSMTVASVDAETGRTVLISLPRNLVGAPLPRVVPAAQEVPQGLSVQRRLLHAERDLHLRDDAQEPLPRCGQSWGAGDQGGDRGRHWAHRSTTGC